MPRKKAPVSKDRMVHIRLTEEFHRLLKVTVAREGKSIQDWVAALNHFSIVFEGRI